MTSKKKDKLVSMQGFIEPEVREAYDREAARTKTSRSHVARLALDEYYKKHLKGK